MCSVFSLQDWCRGVCEGYSDVQITDMSSSFTDGLAFCAIIHKHRPDLLDFHSLSKHNAGENMRLAFSVAERELGVPALLDPDELLCEEPDLLSIITYVSQLYCVFSGRSDDTQKNHMEDEPHRTRANTWLFSSDVIRSSDRSVCRVCHTHVHLIQRILVKGRLYHRSCFRCSVCRRSLLPISFTEHSETGSLRCSKPAGEHTDQHSHTETERERGEADGEIVEKMSEVCLSDSPGTDQQAVLLHDQQSQHQTDRSSGETDRNDGETEGDRGEADRNGGETDSKRVETDINGGETDRNREEADRICGETEDRGETDRNRGETDQNGGETDEDVSDGRLSSSSSESDVQTPPRPAPRKRAEPQDHPCLAPRSHDHPPENVLPQRAVPKDHPWLKLVNPGPWYHLPPVPVYSRHRPPTFNPFQEVEEEDKQRNSVSCETSVSHKPQTSCSAPSMHQATAVHGFPLIKRKINLDTRVSEQQVCVEQQKLEERLQDLERRGVQLERDMRTRSDQSLLVDWFFLVHQKSMLVRRDGELMYMLKQQRLEDDQADVELEIRRLFNKPELDWTEEDRGQEQQLMSRLLSIIQQRSDIISSLELDRQREQEEDEMLSTVIQRRELLTDTHSQLHKGRRRFKQLQIFQTSSRKKSSR
ncbi:MICAL-like protein 1 isoform X1 [Danio rerio]|uniref:MICAL-like protein 1 isoform X1 n=1 Tax=Danio rerio TaxID=7955 RepID=A0ACD6B5U0_DANRE